MIFDNLLFMRNSIFIFVALILFSFTPTKDEPYVLWNKERKLLWSDFNAKPNNLGAEAAMTSSSIEFGYSATNTKYQFQIISKFFPNLSWSIKSKQSNYILQHEQLHFDITELYTRKLIKSIQDNVKTKKDVNKISVLVQKNMSDWNKDQDLYDKETKHSINTEKQAYWNEYVNSQLDSMQKYTNYKFVKILK